MGALFWELTLRMERGAALERRVFLALEVIAARLIRSSPAASAPRPLGCSSSSSSNVQDFQQSSGLCVLTSFIPSYTHTLPLFYTLYKGNLSSHAVNVTRP